MPTLSDVAVAAGVSRKTVSRFVNGNKSVDPAIGDRIAAALELLGYARRSAAEAKPADPGPAATRRPTMNDVAELAGVALKTVSRFVNGETNIDPVLSDRIATAIASLGYRRNLAAAGIRPGWTNKMLGLIITDLANPFYSTLSRAIELYARDQGYLLTIGSSDDEGARHDQLVDRLLGQRVDGLIVVPPRDAGRDWKELVGHLPPVVFLDRPLDFEDADVVVTNNFDGARSATAELIQQGAVNVAFVGDSLEIYTIADRLRGYRAAIHDAGIERADNLVLCGAHNEAQAASIVEQLLEENVADAIFAANNRATVGALQAFRRAGRRIPLIGFDDFEAAPLLSPGISVVSQNIQEMGRKAAEIVISRISGTKGAHSTHILPPQLVLRGSEIPVLLTNP